MAVGHGHGDNNSELSLASMSELDTRSRAVSLAPRYMTASDGWKFPPPSPAPRSDARRTRCTPLVKEPAGLRHAITEHATRTLCGASATGLSRFPNVGFFSSRASERCSSCEAVAVRAEATDPPSLG